MSAIWLNGQLVEDDRAHIGVHDRGFTLGDGLFETMRAYGGRVPRLEAHLQRLRAGAVRIGLPLPGDLEDAVRQTVEANACDHAAVRLTVSRGPDDHGLELPEPSRPTVVVTVRPYAPLAAWYECGVRAVVSGARLNEHAAIVGLKHLGRLDLIVARRQAREAGFDEALLLNTARHLAEGTVSNVFLVVEGVLHTPALSCGPLPGITRAAAIDLAAERGLTVREEVCPPELSRRADEAFLTNSLREIVPLVNVDGRPVGDGRPGPLTLALLDAYRALARSPSSRLAPIASFQGRASGDRAGG